MTAACFSARIHSRFLLAALAAAAALAVGDAAAQTSITWSGAGANTNWSTAGNWTSGTAPTTSGTWAITFVGTTGTANTDNITPAITVSNLAFSTGTGFTISRSSTASITIINGGTFSNTTNITNRFEVPLTLGGTATFSIPTGTLNLFGTTSGGTLIKTGGGSLGLWGSDYSTTAFRVQGGVLGINNASQIPSGSVSLEGGNLTMATGNYAFQVALSANATVRGYASQSPVFTSSTFNTQTAAGSDVTLTLGGGNGGEIQGLIQDNTSKKVALAINQAGANWRLSGSNSYSGGTTITSGTATAANANALGTGLVAVNGGLLLNGLTATAYGLSGNSSGVIGSATNASVLAVNTTGQTTTFSGTIQDGSGTMRLTALGTGTLTLSGSNTYTGATTISGGNLALGSAGSFANSGTVTVGDTGSSGAVLDLTAKTGTFAFTSGQTVRGIGTINIGAGKTVSSAGIWAPGNSIGSNTVTGNLTLTGTSQFELGTPGTSLASPGTSDFTAVSGTLALGGNLQLIDNANAGGLGSYGAGSYRLFTAPTVSGTFASVTTPNALTRAGMVYTSGTASGQGVFANVYNLASATSTQTVNVGNVRAGTAQTAAVSLTNAAPANATYTETLSTGGFSSTSANFTATGSASGIAGGSSGSGTLLVGLGSGLTAGPQSGTTVVSLFSNAVNSSGLAQQSIASQTITITGTVFNPAVATTSGSVNLGTVIVGATSAWTQALSITNSAPTGGFSESLNASFGTLSGVTTNSGSFNLLSSGSTNNTALAVALSTGSVGNQSGSAQINFQTDGQGTSGLAAAALSPQTVNVYGTVLDHATSSLAGSLLTSNTISLGEWSYATNSWQSGGGTAVFDIHNIASSFGAQLTADLALLGVSGTADGFSTNLNTYTDIAGGSSRQFSILTDTSGWTTSGLRTATFLISMGDKVGMAGATSSNTLAVTAQVMVVPEPGALALAGVGIGLAGWLLCRRTSDRLRPLC